MFGLDAIDMSLMTGAVLYFTIFALPFIQEDAAVIGAATASITGAGQTEIILPAILAGLVCSDAWKYWLGHMARSRQWAHRFAKKPGVSIAGDLICKEFVQTMLTARFVPGTRIPTYVAAGFFKIDYPKYIITLCVTAVLYVAIVFGLFHALGAVAGEKAKFWLPIGAVVLLVGYVGYRWLNHLNKREGAMVPIIKEFDQPIPARFDAAPVENESKTAREKIDAV